MTVDSVDMAAAGTAPEAAHVTGLRLFTRTGVTPRWLARSIIPAFDTLRERAAILYLRRGWLHGPHVDLVARAGGGSAFDWTGIASGLDAGPLDPDRQITDEAYLDQAREFGRMERVPPPYLPMRAHGAVEFLRAEDVEVWPHPLNGLREMALSHLGRPVVRTVTETVATPASATARVAEAFAALADAHQSGAAFGAFSLHSHAEAFLTWVAPRTDVRPAFARRLAADSPLLRTIVERTLAGDTAPTATAWRTAFAYCMGAFDCAVANDLLTLDRLDELHGGVDPDTMGPPGATRAEPGLSDFHRTVGESGVIDDPSRWFASYRLLVNLFYQQLPLLGVAPMHRYYLCFAVARTIDEVLGESWQDRIDRAARTWGSGPVSQDAPGVR